MTETPRADALLTALISGPSRIEAFADLTDEHEREKALYVLLALLSDPNPLLQVRATRALGALGDQRAAAALISNLSDIEYGSDLDQQLLFVQFETLATLGDSEAIMPMLKYRRPRIAMIAHRKVRQFDEEVRLRVLGDAVNHPDDAIRENVMRALGSIHDPRSIKLLIKALDDPCADVRNAIAFSLKLMKATEAVPFLITHITDQNAMMRERIAMALGELGDPQAIPALRLLLDDSDKQVGFKAAVALGQLGDPLGLDLIYEYVTSRETYYASDSLRHARESFKTLGLQALPYIVEMVNTILTWDAAGRNPLVLIAKILAEQGDRTALPALKRLLESGHDTVQAAAQQAIDRIRAVTDDSRIGSIGQPRSDE